MASGSPGAPSPPLPPQPRQPCLPSLLTHVAGVLSRTFRVSCGLPRHLSVSLGPPRGPAQATKIGASVPTATHLAGSPGRCRPGLRRCHFDQIHVGEEASDENRAERWQDGKAAAAEDTGGGAGTTGCRCRSRGDRWRRRPPRPELDLFSSALSTGTVAPDWPPPGLRLKSAFPASGGSHFRPLPAGACGQCRRCGAEPVLGVVSSGQRLLWPVSALARAVLPFLPSWLREIAAKSSYLRLTAWTINKQASEALRLLFPGLILNWDGLGDKKSRCRQRREAEDSRIFMLLSSGDGAWNVKISKMRYTTLSTNRTV